MDQQAIIFVVLPGVFVLFFGLLGWLIFDTL